MHVGAQHYLPTNMPASIKIDVTGSDSKVLVVSAKGPNSSDIPVNVTGTESGFVIEFTPVVVGNYPFSIMYNNVPANFSVEAYDAGKVVVSHIPEVTVGRPVEFMVNTSMAGKGKLVVLISAGGSNIPLEVQPQGSSIFIIRFVPKETIEHIISISFNNELVTPAPLTVVPGM